ncbi:TPA: DUF4116 domain-containing protein, partial [Clostridioides difficile]
ICMEAMRENGWALQYVKEQTEEICMEAVREDGEALQYVKNQTLKVCIESIRQNKWALEYVKEQTKEICIYALKQDKHLIKYIRNKEEYEDMIRYLKEQEGAQEVIAIKKGRRWLFTVGCQRDITKEKFIHRIYNTNGGFDPEKGINVHRQIYLNFLKEFE